MMRQAFAFRRRAGLARLAASRDGAAAIEFALVAPVFMLLLLGFADLGQMAYARGILNGAVERAARGSSLEDNDTGAADKMVQDAIKPILPGATFATSRKSYFDFADVNRPEKWSDKDGNGTCNNGEAYVDENRSGQWEADIGKASNGGSGDVVIYTVVVTYKPVFSTILTNSTGNRTLTATGVRKNQPYAAQNGYGSSAGTCP